MSEGDPARPKISATGAGGTTDAAATAQSESERYLLEQLNRLQTSDPTDASNLLDEALQLLRDQPITEKISPNLIEVAMDTLVTVPGDQVMLERCCQLGGLLFRRNPRAMVHSLVHQVPYYARDARPDRVIRLLRVADGVLEGDCAAVPDAAAAFAAFARCVRKNLAELLRRCCEFAGSSNSNGIDQGALLINASQLCDLACRVDLTGLSDPESCCSAAIDCLRLAVVKLSPGELIGCLERCNRLLALLWAASRLALRQSLEGLFAELAAAASVGAEARRGELLALSLRNVPIGIVQECCAAVAERYADNSAAFVAILDSVLHSLRFPGQGAVDCGWLLYLLQAALRRGRTVTCLAYMRDRLNTVAALLLSPYSRATALTVFDFFVLTNRPGVALSRDCLEHSLLPSLMSSSGGAEDTEALRDLSSLAWAMRAIWLTNQRRTRAVSSGTTDDFFPVGSRIRALVDAFPQPPEESVTRRLRAHSVAALSSVAPGSANAVASAAATSTAAAYPSTGGSAVRSVGGSGLSIGRLGVLNLGNTCYAGAALQLLAACARRHPGLPGALMANSASSSSGNTSSATTAGVVTVSERLSPLLRTLLQLSQSQPAQLTRAVDAPAAVNPHSFLLRSRPPGMSPGSQQDSAEYLLHVIDSLIEEEKKMQQQQLPSSLTDSAISQCFGGSLVQRLRCSRAGHLSKTTAPFVTLDLALRRHSSGEQRLVQQQQQQQRQHNTVSQMLGDYLQPEYLTGEHQLLCEHCREKVDAEKRISLRSLPNCLILVLKLFHYDPGLKAASKVTSPQSAVRLEPRILVPVETDDGGSSFAAAIPYRLEAFIVHHGMSLHSGHYTAVCRHLQQQQQQRSEDSVASKWIHANDDCVSYTSLEEWSCCDPVCDDGAKTTSSSSCGGGGSRGRYQTPYILLYVREDSGQQETVE